MCGTICQLVADGSATYCVHLLDNIELGVILGNEQVIVTFDLEHIAGQLGPRCGCHVVSYPCMHSLVFSMPRELHEVGLGCHFSLDQ